jgi:ABC-type nitrate/sulfonate/bicarbonate transport system substrate-binding protein
VSKWLSNILVILVGLALGSDVRAQVTKIRMGTTAATSTEKVAFALAKDAGILKQHNLELEIVLITGGPVAMQALMAKSLDIITTSATVFTSPRRPKSKAKCSVLRATAAPTRWRHAWRWNSSV